MGISIFATFIGLFTLNPALTTLNVWVKYVTNGDASFFHGFACKSHTNLEMPHLAHYPNTRVKWEEMPFYGPEEKPWYWDLKEELKDHPTGSGTALRNSFPRIVLPSISVH